MHYFDATTVIILGLYSQIGRIHIYTFSMFIFIVKSQQKKVLSSFSTNFERSNIYLIYHNVADHTTIPITHTNKSRIK